MGAMPLLFARVREAKPAPAPAPAALVVREQVVRV